MVGFGNKVRLPDGRTFEPRYVYTAPPPPPYYQPPQYTPPQPVPNAPPPEQEPPEPSYVPDQTPSAGSGPGPLTPEQKEVLYALEGAAVDAGASCAGEAIMQRWLGQQSHGIRCFALKTLEGAYHTISREQVKAAICSNPDALQRIPLVTPQRESDIVAQVGCS